MDTERLEELYPQHPPIRVEEPLQTLQLKAMCRQLHSALETATKKRNHPQHLRSHRNALYKTVQSLRGQHNQSFHSSNNQT